MNTLTQLIDSVYASEVTKKPAKKKKIILTKRQKNTHLRHQCFINIGRPIGANFADTDLVHFCIVKRRTKINYSLRSIAETKIIRPTAPCHS